MPAGNEELKLVRTLEAIKIAKKGVWDGVYTAAQAERGKANFLSGRCGGCHQLDLTGDRGPALKGDGFLSHWENGSLNSLFKKISETMPPNGPTRRPTKPRSTSSPSCCSRTAFRRARRAEARRLSARRASRSRRKVRWRAPNFALVQVVGCLTQAPNNAWMLTRTTEPVVTKQEEPTAG